MVLRIDLLKRKFAPFAPATGLGYDMAMQKIHLDTDLGGDIDDLCALAMVLAWPEAEITGITVPGDSGGKRAGYVRYALDVASRSEIPVAAGADTALGCYRYELGLPDEKRYWPEPVSPAPNDVQLALDLLKDSIEQGAVIAGIGPLTNLYLLEMKYPGILGRADLALMGGFVTPHPGGCPEWTHEDDFNLQVDVRSARSVLEKANPILVQLPVTAGTALRRAHLERLRSANPLGRLIARQAEAFAEDEKMDLRYGRRCKHAPDDIINFQYDALACAVALGWRDGVEIETLPLVIDEKDGYLREQIDPRGKPMRVVTRADGERFNRFWLQLVTSAA